MGSIGMFLNKDSVIIDGISMGKYLLKVRYGYHKIWSEDTGRTLSFKQIGTLGGIFPKLTLYFRSLNEQEVELLAPILDREHQSVTYDDPVKKRRTMATYSGDWEIEYENMDHGKPFTCSFIATEKRR